MSYINEQNVLKYNLFKALNDNREYINLPINKKVAAQKHGLFLFRESIDQGSPHDTQSKHIWKDDHIQERKDKQEQDNKLNQQRNNIQNEIQSPTAKKNIHISRQATQNAYQKIQQQNLKNQEMRQHLQNSQNSVNSTGQIPDIYLSYSRTLSSLKELNIQDFGKTIIKKLIEKQNKKQFIQPKFLIDQSIRKGEEQISSVRNQSIEQKSIAVSEFNQNNQVQYVDQNEQVSTLRTHESIQDYPQTIIDTNRDRELSQTTTTNNFYLKPIDRVVERSDNVEMKYEISIKQSQHDNHQEQNNEIRYKIKANQNINHNSNNFTTMGQQFIMKNSLYESQRNEDPQSGISSQIALLSSRRKAPALGTKTMRQKHRSLRDLSPDNSSNFIRSFLKSNDGDNYNRLNHLSKQNLNTLTQQDQSQNSLPQYNQQAQLLYSQYKKKDKDLKAMQFYAQPTQKRESDQNYSSHHANVRMAAASSKYFNSPCNISRKSITLQLNNNGIRSGVHTPSKISAKFRQSFKESIERHATREYAQLMEIQKLFSDTSVPPVLPTNSIKEEFALHSNNDSMMKNSKNITQSSFKKLYQSTQSTNNNNPNSRQASLERYYDSNINAPFLTKTEGILQKTDESNNLQTLDAKLVFENLPLHQQISELNCLHRVALNSQQSDAAKFIFSQQNFKRRNQPQKKIFKV